LVASRKIGPATVTFRKEPGSAPTLVCIHGSADNHHVYDVLLDALPGRARYALNLPGRAGADGPPLTSVREMEAFLARFIEAEVAGSYVIVGHSLGGAVAIEHALQAPPRLEGVVLLATGARLRVHPMILQLFEQVEASGQKIPPLPPGLYEADVDPALVAKAARDRELTPLGTGRADWRAADGFDRMSDIGQIQVPALIVAGTDDALTPPKYAKFMADAIGDSELRLIEDAGHMLVTERAREVAAWIEAFLNRADGRLRGAGFERD
jgi:pimeloyl-ACP methyl ester carboxylesterase